MYVIVKHVKTQTNRTLPVIMLDTQGEENTTCYYVRYTR